MSESTREKLGRYELVEKIGQGGMGVVWKAVDTRLHRAVALKLLPDDLADDSQRLERFEREARMAATLNHPNIVTLHSIEDEGEIPFITMELVEGETLRETLARGRLPLRRFFQLAVALCDAVAEAHHRGIVHRDLKPANVMVNTSGRLKVLDFGLARLREDRKARSGGGLVDDDPSVTLAGEVVGTLAYMAPEQLRGLGADPRTDVFSLGIVLYEMVTGEHPFPSENAAELVSAILRDEPRPPHTRIAELPLNVGEAILHCLEKQPDRRFQDGRQLHRALSGLRTAVFPSADDGDATVELPGTAPARRPAARPLEDDATLERPAVPPETPTATLGADAVRRLRRPQGPDGETPASWNDGKKSVLLDKTVRVRPAAGGVANAVAAMAEKPPPSGSAVEASIAVLPFNDLSPARDQEYFCDGLAEDITSALSRVPGLSAAARTSAFAFKGKSLDVREIGERLGVATILEGSVRKAGEQLRINVQLSKVADGFTLWSERYDRRLDDVFAIQDEISAAIVEKLKLELLQGSTVSGGTVSGGIGAGRGTRDVAAYELYLKGRFEWFRRTEPSLRRGIELFREAIEADPSYALAHVGLADSYNMMAFYCFMPPGETFPEARKAARRALELDDGLAEAHVSMAYVRHYHDWAWADAEAGFQRALELKPDYPLARQWYFNLLICLGRHQEAWEQVSTAKELDPSSAFSQALLGWVRYYLRDYGLAIKLLEKAHELDATYAPAYVWRSWACLEKGLHDEALEALRQAVAHGGKTVLTEAYTGYAYARLGKTKFAQGAIYRMGRYRYAPAYLLALVRLGLGEKEKALDLLEEACDERSHFMALLGAEPRFDPLRGEPRFKALIERVGLPPESSSYPVVVDADE